MTDEPARVTRIWRELDGESLDDVLEDERRGQDSASTTPPTVHYLAPVERKAARSHSLKPPGR